VVKQCGYDLCPGYATRLGWARAIKLASGLPIGFARHDGGDARPGATLEVELAIGSKLSTGEHFSFSTQLASASI
jgi:hypothetical protein